MDIKDKIFNITKSLKNSKLVKIDDSCILIEDTDCNVLYFVNLIDDEIYKPISNVTGSDDFIEYVRDVRDKKYIAIGFKSGYEKHVNYKNIV